MVGRVSLEVQRDKKTGFAAALIVFEAPQEVEAVLRTFGGRTTAAPMMLPLAMVTSRL